MRPTRRKSLKELRRDLAAIVGPIAKTWHYPHCRHVAKQLGVPTERPMTDEEWAERQREEERQRQETERYLKMLEDAEKAGIDLDDIPPERGDQVSCDRCGMNLVSYEPSRTEQICEECQRKEEMERIYQMVDDEADRLIAGIERMGLSVLREHSASSEAVYLRVFIPTWHDEDEEYDEVKIRVAAHDPRPTYGRLFGEADFEVGTLEGETYRASSNGSVEECLRWIASLKERSKE